MAAVTSTASTAVSSGQPRIPRGPESITRVQTFVPTMAVSPTLSTQDVILFPDLKIPHGALITDIDILGRIQVDGASVLILECGVQGGTADLFGSATLTSAYAKVQVTNGAVLPYRVSVSDDATTRYINPMLRVDGNVTSPTVSYTITLMVRYIQDT